MKGKEDEEMGRRRKGEESIEERAFRQVMEKKEPIPGYNVIEKGRPEEAAVAIDRLTDRMQAISDIAKECGLPEQTLRALLGRMRARYQPLNEEIRRVKTEDLVTLLEDRAHRALHYLDDFALAGASAKDLAIAIGILIEKRQLLQGQPTQILTAKERESLNELLPDVFREAQRRGLVIDVDPTDGTTTRVLGSRGARQQFTNLSRSERKGRDGTG